jgi:FkbM family methyltransferase
MNTLGVIEDAILEAGLKLDSNGKISIPPNFHRIKIDVGLSSNAPQSAVWLQEDSELVVIGFEPVSANREMIENGTSPFKNRIDRNLVKRRFFLLPFALANSSRLQQLPFFVTSEDTGCSSLLQPKTFGVSHKEDVFVIPLSEILRRLPWSHFQFVDHLKTDCQGMDLEIIRSAKKYLRRIAFVTTEPENNQYFESKNPKWRIYLFMLSQGFIPTNLIRCYLSRRMKSLSVDDPTFVNFRILMSNHELPQNIFQRG